MCKERDLGLTDPVLVSLQILGPCGVVGVTEIFPETE